MTTQGPNKEGSPNSADSSKAEHEPVANNDGLEETTVQSGKAKVAGTVNSATKATFGQKLGLALALLILTILIVAVWFYALYRFNEALNTDVTVSWNASAQLRLRSGPSSFWYEEESGKLHHRGHIDDDLKKVLVSLPIVAQEDDAQLQGAVQSYSEAIDELTYQSDKLSKHLFVYILFLGSLSGILGVQLRSVTDFVGITCFKNQLDLSQWWPWYAMRPLVGLLVGMILVLILEAGLMSVGEASGSAASWPLAVACLAGFGATDFTEKLRLLAKTLFGGSS